MVLGGESILGVHGSSSGKVSEVHNKGTNQESMIFTNLHLEERIRGCAALTNCKSFDHALAGFLSQEPWPDDVQLFQPYETEQILLPDNANCLAVQTFLKMCDLKYVVEYRTNAEEMSPSGRVPFIKCGACLISDFEPITSFVSNKGISLSAHLDEVQKADMRAFMSLVNTVLGNAENFITWVDSETYNKITKPRYGSVHPFPLNHWLCFSKRRTVLKKLSALGWANKSLENVYDEVEKGCSALSDRLEKSKFFFGDQPCEVDAYLFGHVYAILTMCCMPAGLGLSDVIRRHPLIVNHCKAMMKKAGFARDVDTPVYHRSCAKGNTESDLTDEFSCVIDDDDDTDYPYTQTIQDYSCMINEENTIYDAVFGEVLDLEDDLREEVYQS